MYIKIPECNTKTFRQAGFVSIIEIVGGKFAEIILMKRSFTAIAILLIFISACKSAKLTEDPDDSVLDKYWKVVAIKNNGLQATSKEAFLILKTEDKRVLGNGGCNSFFGSYQLDKGNQIRFSAIGATKMACENMQVESAFFQVFAATRSYATTGNELLLMDSVGTDLAKFEFVEGKN
jgi:heat shock protein HslJ